MYVGGAVRVPGETERSGTVNRGSLRVGAGVERTPGLVVRSGAVTRGVGAVVRLGAAVELGVRVLREGAIERDSDACGATRDVPRLTLRGAAPARVDSVRDVPGLACGVTDRVGGAAIALGGVRTLVSRPVPVTKRRSAGDVARGTVAVGPPDRVAALRSMLAEPPAGVRRLRPVSGAPAAPGLALRVVLAARPVSAPRVVRVSSGTAPRVAVSGTPRSVRPLRVSVAARSAGT